MRRKKNLPSTFDLIPERKSGNRDSPYFYGKKPKKRCNFCTKGYGNFNTFEKVRILCDPCEFNPNIKCEKK